MNRLLMISIAAALMSTAAAAQDRSTDNTIPPVQPPPAMDDAPVAAPAPAATVPSVMPKSQMKVAPEPKTIPLGNSDAEVAASVEEAKRRASTPVPVLPPDPDKKFDSPGLPPEVQKAAEATELPVVTVRQEGNTTIEEYRRHGKLFAQHIITKDSGEAKWYVDQRYKGPMPGDAAAGVSGHVAPVEYKLFEWK